MNELRFETLDLHNDQDVTEVARKHCEAPAEWIAGHSYSADTVNKTVRTLRNAERSSYVMLARDQDDEIVGMHWVQLEVRPEASFGNVFSLWVHPQYRQKGVATHLKELAELWLRKNGASEIRTNAYAKNRRMMTLDKKLGYKVVLVGMSKHLN